jgi:phosphatidylserine decarboxylase
MYEILRYLPRNHLSWAIGSLAHVPLPRPLASALIRWFSRAYAVKLEEAEHPPHHYPSLGAFFTRNLVSGVRPIGEGIVSPVDGTLRNCGPIEAGALEQVKGKRYTLAEFLASEEDAARFSTGYYFNFYLSPPDYHHVHAPVDGSIVRVVHIPGTLWPVNDWSMRTIDKLFAVNERVVVHLDTEAGACAVVFVGATNVGKISLACSDLVTNRLLRSREIRAETVTPPRAVRKGERLGTFHLGSTAVVLFERGSRCRASVTGPLAVRLGMTVGSVETSSEG